MSYYFVLILICAMPPSAADQVSKVIENYQARVLECKRNKESPESFQIPLKARNAALRQIIDANVGRTDLATRDFEALALSYEFVKDPKGCVSLCERAKLSDQTSAKTYQSWFRSLMNLKQRTEATDVMNEGIKKFGDTSIVNNLHLMLYMVDRTAADFQRSAHHAQALVDYKLRIIQSDPTACVSLVTFLERYVEVHLKSNQQPRCLATLSRAYELVSPNAKTSQSKIRGIQFLHLMCELCRLHGNSDQFSQHAADLLHRQAENLLQNPNRSGAHVLFGKGLSYLADSCFALSQPKIVSNQVEKIIVDFEKSGDDKLLAQQPRLKNLNQLLQLRSTHLSLEGSTLEAIDLDEVYQKQPAVDKQHARVLLFWAPAGTQAFRGFELVDRWERDYNQHIETQCVAPYCGFTWSDPTGIALSRSVKADDERSMLRQFVIDQKIAGDAHALVKQESAIWKKLHLRFLPQVVLMDEKHQIKKVLVGLSPIASNYLEREIHRLCTQDTVQSSRPQ